MAEVTTHATFSVESMVRGYHVYKDVRAASVGEHLPCRRENYYNLADRFAVAVMKGGTVVGHIPRKISNVCSIFIRKGGSIYCLTTGSRRFSSVFRKEALNPCNLVLLQRLGLLS